MHEAAAAPAWVLIAYLIAGICFILALRGLSSPTSSQRGNRLGMIGMAIAVVTTLVTHLPGQSFPPSPDPGEASITLLETGTLWEIAAAILLGGAIGLVTARRIQMTAMPQLVAAFHSLVGMAAVLVGAAAFLNPEAFGIVGPDGIHQVSRVEMGLGVAIGAITFSGSVIAFLKLNGNMSGAPILLPLRHVINLATIAA
ncbi:MAG TPA: NAD(P)(+) transhydrogenase (Re/Si-specific) subunit beta, partial [Sphingomicrobium sp.]|nr:NAD(P)(+) transhydrogenase (Re/Si-specific) subunit beta [Sphingomicrobium sp.]